MRALIIAVLGASLLSASAAAHKTPAKEKCDDVKRKIRKIESRMRQGYSHRQGERLAERLRELRAERSKHCR